MKEKNNLSLWEEFKEKFSLVGYSILFMIFTFTALFIFLYATEYFGITTMGIFL